MAPGVPASNIPPSNNCPDAGGAENWPPLGGVTSVLFTGVTSPCGANVVAFRFLSSVSGVKFRFLLTEFRCDVVGELSLDFLIEFLRADVRVGTGSTTVVVEFPPPRFRFLMTSVLRDNGRTTPWSLRNKPHALHNGWPSGCRRHKGVLVV